METLFIALLIISGPNLLVIVATAANQECPESFTEQRTLRTINCKSSEGWSGLDANLTASGNQYIDISFAWPLPSCENFEDDRKTREMRASLQIIRLDRIREKDKGVHLTKLYSVRSNSSRPRISGTLEKFQFRAAPGKYTLVLRIGEEEKWELPTEKILHFIGETWDGNLKFDHSVTDEITLRGFNAVSPIFDAVLKPNLDRFSKVLVTMANTSYYGCNCNPNVIDWDVFEDAPNAHGDRTSIKKKCAIKQMMDKSQLHCTFDRRQLNAGKLFYKVSVVGNSFCNGGSGQHFCCSTFEYTVLNINTTSPMNETEFRPSPKGTYITMVVVVICILATIGIVTILIKFNKLLITNSEKENYIKDSPHDAPLLPADKNNLDLTILLIYYNTTEAFVKTVMEFKSHLQSVFPASELVDIRHEDYEQQFNTLGYEFITRFTREGSKDPKVKIVFIHSSETAGCLHACKGRLMTCNENEKQARLVYKELIENPCQLRYNKVYNVFFDAFPLNNADKFINLNKLASYRFPTFAHEFCEVLAKY